MAGNENRPPPGRAAAPAEAEADDKILLGGGDQDHFTPVDVILADLHELVDGMKADTGWGESARNRAEFQAWIAGRRRICDLAGVEC